MASWADHFNTYTEACEFYGVDTPAQIRAEQQAELEAEWVDMQDLIEARGVRVPEPYECPY